MSVLTSCWTRPFVWTFIHSFVTTSGRREMVKDSRNVRVRGRGRVRQGGYVRGMRGVKVKGHKVNEERQGEKR